MTGATAHPSMRTCCFDGGPCSAGMPSGDGGGSSSSPGNDGNNNHAGNTVSSLGSSEVCRDGVFQQGQHVGGSQNKLAVTYATAAACSQGVKKNCPWANGATYTPTLGECWCNRDMGGIVSE